MNIAANRNAQSFHFAERETGWEVGLRGAFGFRPAGISQAMYLPDSKGIAERKQKRSGRIARARVEIVAVFKANGTDDRPPAQPSAN